MSSGCNCGSNCSCGDNCNCSRPRITEEKETTQTIILGVSPMKMNYVGSEGFGEENGCKCGSDCSCDPCSC